MLSDYKSVILIFCTDRKWIINIWISN